MSKQISQEQKIIDYMNRFNGITQLEALRDLSCMRKEVMTLKWKQSPCVTGLARIVMWHGTV